MCRSHIGYLHRGCPHGLETITTLPSFKELLQQKPSLELEQETQHITPVRRGPYLSTTSDPSWYKKRVHECSKGLIGRLILSIRDKPWKIEELSTCLQQLWDISGAWKLIPLGKGHDEEFLECKTSLKKSRKWRSNKILEK